MTTVKFPRLRCNTREHCLPETCQGGTIFGAKIYWCCHLCSCWQLRPSCSVAQLLIGLLHDSGLLRFCRTFLSSFIRIFRSPYSCCRTSGMNGTYISAFAMISELSRMLQDFSIWLGSQDCCAVAELLSSFVFQVFVPSFAEVAEWILI